MWAEVLPLLSGYLLGGGGVQSAAVNSPGQFAFLWGGFIAFAAILIIVVAANVACCCGCLGLALGFTAGRTTRSAVPSAAAEGALLVGEATALASRAAASAARRRLQGYSAEASPHALGGYS